MESQSSLGIRAFLRAQWASRYLLAVAVGLHVERVLDVNENVGLLILFGFFGLFSLPWQRVPAVRLWAFGVPAWYGIDGEPLATRHVRLGHEELLRFTGDDVRRVIEIDAGYRVEFTDLQIGLRWREVQQPDPTRRRYEESFPLAYS